MTSLTLTRLNRAARPERSEDDLSPARARLARYTLLAGLPLVVGGYVAGGVALVAAVL